MHLLSALGPFLPLASLLLVPLSGVPAVAGPVAWSRLLRVTSLSGCGSHGAKYDRGRHGGGQRQACGPSPAPAGGPVPPFLA
ncbi:MAG TPA: hypothetical protein VKI20_05290 [Acidimicrobiales bacterium]|nr:hypothetical protein [Acidimicrobiales bacterium]